MLEERKERRITVKLMDILKNFNIIDKKDHHFLKIDIVMCDCGDLSDVVVLEYWYDDCLDLNYRLHHYCKSCYKKKNFCVA